MIRLWISKWFPVIWNIHSVSGDWIKCPLIDLQWSYSQVSIVPFFPLFNRWSRGGNCFPASIRRNSRWTSPPLGPCCRPRTSPPSTCCRLHGTIARSCCSRCWISCRRGTTRRGCLHASPSATCSPGTRLGQLAIISIFVHDSDCKPSPWLGKGCIYECLGQDMLAFQMRLRDTIFVESVIWLMLFAISPIFWIQCW